MTRPYRVEQCSVCLEDRAYPDGFPDPELAQCWFCAWGQHMVKAHPLYSWRVWNRARKAALDSHPATDSATPGLRLVKTRDNDKRDES